MFEPASGNKCSSDSNTIVQSGCAHGCVVSLSVLELFGTFLIKKKVHKKIAT